LSTPATSRHSSVNADCRLGILALHWDKIAGSLQVNNNAGLIEIFDNTVKNNSEAEDHR
jgi:hypothetical protein